MDKNSKKPRNNSKRDNKLKSFIDRLEGLSDENTNINFDIKEVFF